MKIRVVTTQIVVKREIPTLTGGSAVANELGNIIFELNLFQHIDQPTHIQGNVLDQILSGGGDLYGKPFVTKIVLFLGLLLTYKDSL